MRGDNTVEEQNRFTGYGERSTPEMKLNKSV